MNPVFLMTGIGAGALMVYALYQLTLILIYRKKTVPVTAVVSDVQTVLKSEAVKVRNGKWATVTYRVGGRFYSPVQTVPVPMAAAPGMPVKVRYFKEDPGRILTFSWARMLVAAAASLLLVAGGFFL